MRNKFFYLVIIFTSGLIFLNAQENSQQDLHEVFRQLREMQQEIKDLRNENKELKKQMQKLHDKPRQETEELTKEDIFGPTDADEDIEDLRSLREAAKQEGELEMPEDEVEEEQDPTSIIFKSGQLALQALNPEISVVGDFIYRYVRSGDQDYAIHGDEYERSGFEMRTFGIHIESYLDPYTHMKAAISYHDGNIKLGEAYVTFLSFLDNVNITFGKFRQQFGIVNRWHLHGLDQVNFPLPLMKIFGHGGLNQSGISVDWSLPDLGPASQALTLQITNGENDRVFQGEHWTYPVYLVHYKYYRDISKSTYAELGLSALAGPNQRQGFIENGENQNDSNWKWSTVIGADFTVLWEPPQQMRYRNFVWRSEFYFLRQEIPHPDDSTGEDETWICSYGAYSYIQSKISRTMELGIRGDFYIPEHRSFTIPELVSQKPTHIWQIAPYITWMISPFVKFRLEYNYIGGRYLTDEDPREHRVYLQIVFAAGPHKHERY